MDTLLKVTKWITFICLCTWPLTYWFMKELPPASEIYTELYTPPYQQAITPTPFTIHYQGQANKAVAQAKYTLYGVVVSHNDPFSWLSFDLTHDKKSLDTRDLCVVWGSNVKSDDYRKVSYHSDDWMCNFRYNADVRQFNHDELSNNHLITDNEEVRRIISKVNIGDQILIKGFLVNYSEERWGNSAMRNTSLSRTDTGNGACEVIFVQEITILRSYNELWAWLNTWSVWVFFGSLAFRFLCFMISPE